MRKMGGNMRRNQPWCQEKVEDISRYDNQNWNIQLLTDDISVSTSGSQVSVIQQREESDRDRDREDYPDSTTVHSTTGDEEKREVSLILSFHRVKTYPDIPAWENTFS